MENSERTPFKITLSLIAILMFFMAGSAGTFENPGMQIIIDHWTALGVSVESIRMLATLPSLISLPFTLAIGAVVGKKIPYKLTAIISTGSIVVGGLGPFFISGNWSVILAFRALMGVGVGLCASRTALLLSSVPSEKHAQYMGIAQAVSICVGLVSGPIVGVLSGISWRHIFLINIYTVVVFLAMFFIKEPPKSTSPEQAGAGTAAGSKFNPKVLLFAVSQMLATALTYPAIVGISTYLAGHEIGSATMAGTILILYSLGCVAVSSIGTIQKFFKRFTMTFCFAVLALAYALLVLFPSVITAFAALFLVGFGFMGEFSLMQVYVGAAVEPHQMPLATTLLLTGNQIGTFLSTFFMTIAHGIFHLTTDADSTFVLGIIIFIALGLAASVKGLIVPIE